MSMNNKQRWMGGVVLLGGGVLLGALLLKGANELKGNKPDVQTQPNTQQVKQSTSSQLKMGEMQSLQPVTVDVETEKRLLEEQKRARERAVAEQEAKTQQYLIQQQQAEAAAAKKAAEEYAEINARRIKEQESADIPPEVANTAAKAKGASDVDSADAVEQKRQAALLAAKKKADADVKRQAEAAERKQAAADLAEKRTNDLEAKRQAEAKKKAELDKKQHEEHLAAKKKAEQEQKQHHAEELKKKADSDAKHKVDQESKKSETARARKIMDSDDDDDEDSNKTQQQAHKKWMVQVALAANQANADAIVSKLRAKGYKITASPTSKGIRIMVGPVKDKDAADAMRKKVQSDSSLGMHNAWVIEWVPLDQR
ncbi:SPOR domain-containing protein [Acinetobacter nectaris]|uniref:SPOR domain-containing protein n=1 Tax=Acinetobacter nectaris TaxID=1219382 RepID=UPI001EFFA0E4|nr:SPOR domain-containing protein [Acinetobacter nectaris]MCF9000232.1 SPOR domain-containing protein [Acinetobacter nectaris]MCF9028486.1 SPOR domain-containing protein [Acinetobacter nectaris]